MTIQRVHSQNTTSESTFANTTTDTPTSSNTSIETATTSALPWPRKTTTTTTTTQPTTTTSSTDPCISRLGAVATYDGICMDVASDEAYCRCFQTMLREARVFGCPLHIIAFYKDGCRARCSLCDGDDESDSSKLAPSTVAMLGVVVGLALCAVIIGCVLLAQKRRRYNLVAQFNPRPFNPRALREPLAEADVDDAAAVEPVSPIDAEPAPYPPVYTTY
jgi:hypothetical protein